MARQVEGVRADPLVNQMAYLKINIIRGGTTSWRRHDVTAQLAVNSRQQRTSSTTTPSDPCRGPLGFVEIRVTQRGKARRFQPLQHVSDPIQDLTQSQRASRSATPPSPSLSNQEVNPTT